MDKVINTQISFFRNMHNHFSNIFMHAHEDVNINYEFMIFSFVNIGKGSAHC